VHAVGAPVGVGWDTVVTAAVPDAETVVASFFALPHPAASAATASTAASPGQRLLIWNDGTPRAARRAPKPQGGYTALRLGA
jgi:hypothetical protein